jgi:hypothetical protein
MHEELAAEEHRAARPGWVGWAAALLTLGAAISLVVQLLPRWYQIFGPYLIIDPDLALDAVTSATLFALPAAVLLGSARWPAGRRWLCWGAAALAVLALTSLVREAWFAAFLASPDASSQFPDGAWTAVWLGGTAAMVVGHALLAVGLWVGTGGSAASSPPLVRAAGAFVAMASVGVFLASAWTALIAPWNGIQTAILATGGGILLGAAYAALALVAFAALRAMPRVAALPELLIAVGATLAMLSGAGLWVLPSLVLGEVSDVITGVFLALRTASAVGLLLLAVGFGLGAVGGVRGNRAVAAA